MRTSGTKVPHDIACTGARNSEESGRGNAVVATVAPVEFKLIVHHRFQIDHKKELSGNQHSYDT